MNIELEVKLDGVKIGMFRIREENRLGDVSDFSIQAAWSGPNEYRLKQTSMREPNSNTQRIIASALRALEVGALSETGSPDMAWGQRGPGDEVPRQEGDPVGDYRPALRGEQPE